MCMCTCRGESNSRSGDDVLPAVYPSPDLVFSKRNTSSDLRVDSSQRGNDESSTRWAERKLNQLGSRMGEKKTNKQG